MGAYWRLNPAARHCSAPGETGARAIGSVRPRRACAPPVRRRCSLRQAGELRASPAPQTKAQRLGWCYGDAAAQARTLLSLRLAVQVQDRNLPVLVRAETGAGKEIFARCCQTSAVATETLRRARDGPALVRRKAVRLRWRSNF